ncbi:MAG TPA: serine protease [Bacteroidales bacterium]|nr:serine protease [Bacteroidales bacterium]HOH21991.1 serine protease [Bacteroidales bacterium]HPZ03477.1 serine protease [Bacteroidales bacterium]HQB74913.1 serine protease [Bacteroidales bacterium]
MPTWGQLLEEIRSQIQAGDQQAFDTVRNKYLKELSSFTGRDTIIYATRWTSGDAPPNLVSINDEDIHAFMEAISGLKCKDLDLIIHTGGGSAEATDAIVSYLRQKFKHIRIIIPQAAMSAGTMLACSADIIVMGKQSSIGPIDPQFILQTAVGVQSIPAHAILEQFKRAQEDCSTNPKNLNSWLPMLSQYGPALLVRCQDQIDFGKELVGDWLKSFMFKDEGDEIPDKIAEYLSNHGNFKTHGKHINIIKAMEIGLKIEQLESNQDFQDKVLSAFHATMHSFGSTNTAKIIANQNGNCYIKQFKSVR